MLRDKGQIKPSLQEGGTKMPALLEYSNSKLPREDRRERDTLNLESLISAMGKRLQAEYVEGAIPFLRRHEPELWEKLEALDQEESLEALLEYERLFFEGLNRYIVFLGGEQKAA
jgi:hypothetical protein